MDCDSTLNALKTALSERKREKMGETVVSTLSDKREQYMVARLRAALDSPDAAGLKKNDLPAFATFQMYTLIQEQIRKQLQACLKDDGTGDVRWGGNISEIVLLGGIIVNRGQANTDSIEPREDYFQPLVFESYSNSGTLADVEDLYRPVFGAKPLPPFFA